MKPKIIKSNESVTSREDWIYLYQSPLPEAMIQFRDSLKRFALKVGKMNLYHETITYGFMLLISDRMARSPELKTWNEFSGSNSDLLDWKSNPLVNLYTKEELYSELARSRFVLPKLNS